MHDARRDSGSASPAIVRRVGGWRSGLGGSAVRLRCEHLEHVAVRISEIKPASATTVIDLHIVEGAGSAAISNALGADSVEDAVKLRFIDFERIVVAVEIRVVVEIEGQRVVDPQRREVRERTFIAQTQDPGEEARRCFLVMRGHDRMVEHNSHRHLPAGAPVISSERGRGVADFKARGAWRLPASGIADDRTSSAVVDRNRRHLVPGMTIDKSEKGRQQFALVLGRRGANLGGDGLGRAAVELKRALELLVLPPGGVLALAPDPDIGSASALADRGLFGDKSSIKACPCARNDLDDLHERPLPRLPVDKIYNDRPPQHYPGTVPSGPARPSGRRRSAAPFRRFRCCMGGRWDVALARFCWISCMVGAVVADGGRAHTGPSVDRLPVRGRWHRKGSCDHRRPQLYPRRRARDSPRGHRGSARARRRSIGAARRGWSCGPRGARIDGCESKASSCAKTRRVPTATAARSPWSTSCATAFGSRSRTRCWREDSHGFRPMSAIGLAPRSCWPRNGERAAPGLASGVNRTMSSWQPRAGGSLRPSAAVSPWRKGTWCRSARVQERST